MVKPMRRSDVIRLLSGKLLPEQFQEIYGPEIAHHVRSLEKRGASAPINLTGDHHILVEPSAFFGLLRNFLEGAIAREALAYVIDALTLDPNTSFADGELREAAMDLAESDFERTEVVLARMALTKKGAGASPQGTVVRTRPRQNPG